VGTYRKGLSERALAVCACWGTVEGMTRRLAIALVCFLAGCSSGSPGASYLADASGAGGAARTGGTVSTGGGSGAGGTNAAGAGGAGTGGSSGGVGGSAGGSGRGGNGGITQTGGGLAGTGGATSAGGGGAGGADSGGAGSGGAGSGGAADAAIDAREAGTSDSKPDARTMETGDATLDSLRADTSATGNVTVYIAGDSTVSTYTNSDIHQGGWGQFLQNYFSANAKIVNKAVGGMTSRHFIEAGYLDAIVATIKPGDYLLVQFGTNDGNKTATYTLSGSTTAIPYYLDPQTDFKTYLTKYVDATRAKNATTIFVTPPPRHSCSAGETGVANGLSAYATAMKELGPTLNAPVVDLNAMLVAYLANVTCETSGSTFYLVKADGTIDSTHFQENGANIMAGLVAKGTTGISTLDTPLAAYVK